MKARPKAPRIPARAPGKGLSRRGRAARWGLAAASLLGWLLVLGALQSFLDLRRLLEAESSWFRENIVYLSPEIRSTDTLGFRNPAIGDERLERIRASGEILAAAPVLRNRFPVVVRLGGGALPSITSEVFLEAIPGRFLGEGKPEGWTWAEDDGLVPVLAPRQFLHLYNFGFAPGKGLPVVSESLAQRVRFEIIAYPDGGGTPVSFPASIAGFGDRIDSLVVPASFLRHANQRFGGEPDGSAPGRIVALARDAGSAEFARFLSENRLETAGGADRASRIRILLDLSLAVLGSAGGIILLLKLLLLWAETESFLNERRDDLGKLFFLGHGPEALLPSLVRSHAALVSAPAIGGLALLLLLRGVVLDEIAAEGLALPAGLSGATYGLWASILLGGNLWLALRIRRRLRRLYR